MRGNLCPVRIYPYLNNKKPMKSWIRFSVFIATLFVPLLLASASVSPNVVVILADDLGYGDVRALNPRSKIPTPHLDQLAADGMSFTDAHTPSSVCTPTRYGLLTGRYCWRSPLKRGVLNGYGRPLIEPERPTMASFLRGRGYVTGIVGKWHLGLDFARKDDGKTIDYTKPVGGGPDHLGFDHSYIIPASLDFPPYVFVRNGKVTMFPSLEQEAQKFPAYLRKGPRAPVFVMEDCLDHLLEEAIGFVDEQSRNTDQPFFLYLPLTAPHKPVLPHPRFRGKTSLGPYGDFVAQVDWTVGRLLQALEKAGVVDDTLVLFSSDNGSFMHRYEEKGQEDHVDDATVQGYRPEHHTANGIFRGTKADIWEAGHHVPFLARWPGRIKAGTQNPETVCLTDLFATVADVIQAEVPPEAAPDSFSLWPLMKGETWKRPRPPVIHHSAAGMFAIRQGRWKLVLGNGSGGRETPRGKPFEKPYALFDMREDVRERNNVIEEHRDVADRLEEICASIRDR